ncbi:hypothetical protein ABK040_007968 [Willaertia magna]
MSTPLPTLVPLNSHNFKELHLGPTSESNWLMPNKILMSAYPGDLKPEKAKEKIKLLIDSGINCFVCLQQSCELTRFAPYRPLIEDYLGIEKTRETIEFLHFPIPDTHIANNEDVMHFIKNELIPRVNLGLNSDNNSDNNNSDNAKEKVVEKKILLHCWGGHGRTGTICSILLSHLYELSADEALERVGKVHKCRVIAKSNAPQTQSQFKQVRELAFK